MALTGNITEFVKSTLSFRAGQTVFEEGGLADHVFVILQGRVRIRKQTTRGMVTLAVLEKGHVLGETSFFDKSAQLRGATAIAETAARLGVLDPEKLLKEFSRVSPIQQQMLAGLARRIRLTTANAALLAGDATGPSPSPAD